MKKISLILVLIFFINLVSASVIISEFESNPSGSDEENEWVEIYSSEMVNLDGWKLINSDGDIHQLSEIINGYIIIKFSSQWLDNNNEVIFLYNSLDELISETPIKDDNTNNNKCWQRNSIGQWQFEICTKGEQNAFVDFNNNCKINIFDMILLRNKFNTGDLEYDINGDEEVDISDLILMLKYLGNEC